MHYHEESLNYFIQLYSLVQARHNYFFVYNNIVTMEERYMIILHKLIN